MKILLFGGAFDPPHIGHISILKAALEHTNFSKVIVMPTGTPTHKSRCVAPFEVRKKLAEIAFCPIAPTVEVSDYEGTNLQDDYTYLTLRYLKDQNPAGEFFILIGGDSLLTLKDWKNSQEVMESCTIIAFARHQDEQAEILAETQELKQRGAKIIFIQSKITEVSSSQIRLLEEKEKNTADFVDSATKQLIDSYDLYDSHFYKRVIGTSKLLLTLLLNTKRQIHVLNVEQLAVRLGKIHNLDTEKLSVAALLHDIMKRVSPDILLHRARQSDIITRINSKPYPTLHGYAAADYATKELGITDREILSALKSHTCGREGMSDFEKVIYLSDMLSAERDFAEKDYFISLAEKDLDIAMKEALEFSIKWIEEKGKEIDNDSVQALEYFKKLCSAKGRI